jgi:nitroreductase
MSTSDAISQRHSVRAFLDKPVDRALIEALLLNARFAPSGVNTQPWKVDIVQGESLARLSDALLKARHEDRAPNPDYQYYPTEWFEPYTARRQACGAALYGALHIEKRDIEKRLAQWNLNYRFFGAPVGMVVHLDKKLSTGSWLDVGMFIENILVGAMGLGLGTCAQASIAEFPDIVRQSLHIPDTQAIVCGIALGYPDPAHPVNNYRTERLPLDAFTVWHD